MAAAAVMSSASILAPSSTENWSIDKQQSSEPMGKATATTTAELLCEKMAGVLRYTGWNEDAIAKVSSRATTNMVQGTHTPADGDLTDSDTLSLFIDDKLLNKRELEKRHVFLNSNEPVLLVEIPSGLDLGAAQAHQLKDNLLLVLRRRGVKPVRVYARRIAETNSPCIGIVLLNVVNTDIGGPSMIQLLDAAFHGDDWKRDLMLKEAWNGYALLWRDEAWSGSQQHQPEPDIVQPLSEPEEMALMPEASDEPVIAVQHQKSVISVPDEENDIEKEPVEHPAMKELREREASRAHVQHPTWTRDHDNQHLLDIITTHSAGVRETDPISVISRPADDSSEEFEVVDKA